LKICWTHHVGRDSYAPPLDYFCYFKNFHAIFVNFQFKRAIFLKKKSEASTFDQGKLKKCFGRALSTAEWQIKKILIPKAPSPKSSPITKCLLGCWQFGSGLRGGSAA
jgi:hypothetical protein